jgi:hypothetical protein
VEAPVVRSYRVLLDEMPRLGAQATVSLQISRRNSATTKKHLSIDDFGYLVTEWNELDVFSRRERAVYCREKRHDWRCSPYDGMVCARCMKTG